MEHESPPVQQEEVYDIAEDIARVAGRWLVGALVVGFAILAFSA